MKAVAPTNGIEKAVRDAAAVGRGPGEIKSMVDAVFAKINAEAAAAHWAKVYGVER